MDAVVGRDLPREIFNVKTDHLHDRCLTALSELVHIGNDNRMKNPATGSVFRYAENADFFDEGRLRIMQFELFWVNVLAIRKHDDIFAAACDRKVAVFIDDAE